MLLRFTLLAAFFFGSFSARAAPNPIPNFIAIEDGVYRGGRPGPEGVRYLKSLGVRTIINLENEEDYVAAERIYARSLGIATVSAPINDRWVIEHAPVERAVRALQDPSLRPVFIHCKHGKNRTGMVYGLHRVEHLQWHPENAYAEMKRYGFGSYQLFLKAYFKRRTGWDD